MSRLFNVYTYSSECLYYIQNLHSTYRTFAIFGLVEAHVYCRKSYEDAHGANSTRPERAALFYFVNDTMVDFGNLLPASLFLVALYSAPQTEANSIWILKTICAVG